MPTLTREDLDRVMRRGCVMPDCQHQHDDEPFFLHGRCHPYARTIANCKDGILIVNCAECQRLISAISVKQRQPLPGESNDLKCPKHEDGNVDVSYKKGLVVVSCSDCHRTVAALTVVERGFSLMH